MTDQEWLCSIEPTSMLDWLRRESGRSGPTAYNLPRDPPPSPRKLRLALAACCRRVWGSLGHFGRAAVEAVEQVVDGELPESVLADRATAASAEAGQSARHAPGNSANFAAADLCRDQAVLHPDDVLRYCATAAGFAAAPYDVCLAEMVEAHDGPQPINDHWKAVYAAERAAQAGVLREVFGNPFCPACVESKWLAWEGGTLPRLAQSVYDQRDWGSLPVLADALEEAGCADESLLGHLRGPGPHVLGCWALDLILGKE